jgi:hypothetical protein
VTVADDLTDDEIALLEKHRKAKAKNSRKVTVKGRHEESGADYEFELDGDDAERVISRHGSLFQEQADPETGPARKPGAHPYFKGKQAEAG